MHAIDFSMGSLTSPVSTKLCVHRGSHARQAALYQGREGCVIDPRLMCTQCDGALTKVVRIEGMCAHDSGASVVRGKCGADVTHDAHLPRGLTEMHQYPRAPSMETIPALGPKVHKHYLPWGYFGTPGMLRAIIKLSASGRP